MHMVSRILSGPSAHVARLLEELEVVLAYERDEFADKMDEPELDLRKLRGIWLRYRQWLGKAEQINASGAQGCSREELAAIEDAMERVRARLTLDPNQIAKAKDQIRQGSTVPAKELRDELNAKLRA